MKSLTTIGTFSHCFFGEETVSKALTHNKINKYYVKLHNKSIVCDGRRHIFLFENIMKNWCLLLSFRKKGKEKLHFFITSQWPLWKYNEDIIFIQLILGYSCVNKSCIFTKTQCTCSANYWGRKTVSLTVNIFNIQMET